MVSQEHSQCLRNPEEYVIHFTSPRNRWVSFMSITRHRTRNIHLEQFWDGFLHTSLFRIYVFGHFEIIYENQMYHDSRFYNVSQIYRLNLHLCEISCAKCSTLNNIILGENADPINKTSGEISSHNLLRLRLWNRIKYAVNLVKGKNDWGRLKLLYATLYAALNVYHDCLS